MKTSEKAWELINKYFRYLSVDDESENYAASELELISVVRRSDDAVYRMIGITSDVQSEERILKFKSLNPIVKNYDGIGGSSMGYDYCEISESEFDEKFLTYEDWQHGLLNLTIAEMNKEIFKFLHPYFIASEQDWTFELSCKGSIMSIKFWGYGAYKYEKLVIYVDQLNKAHITLYGVGDNESTTIFEYDNKVTVINPVPYGIFTEEDMVKLCGKVTEVMRRNPINKHKERYKMNKRIKKKKQTAINDIRQFDEHLEDCRNLFGVNTTHVSKTYQNMMDHSKERDEFRKKHPELEYMFKAWDREREYLNSHPASSNTKLKILYAEDDIEDSVIISESLANKLLDGTFDGLMNYHAAVAGRKL